MVNEKQLSARPVVRCPSSVGGRNIGYILHPQAPLQGLIRPAAPQTPVLSGHFKLFNNFINIAREADLADIMLQ